MEKACSGFGHRTVFGNIELAVQACVIQAIEMGCTVFYTGAMGEFDSVFISCCACSQKALPRFGITVDLREAVFNKRNEYPQGAV